VSKTSSELQQLYSAVYALLRSRFVSRDTKTQAGTLLVQLGNEMNEQVEDPTPPKDMAAD
jgi:hypothetical protein